MSTTRKIGLNHFAFFRAYLQGMDAKQMWTRYMDVYGPADSRTIRSTLNWLRQEFMAAARRADRPRVAALLKRDPNLMLEDKTPALDDFAQRYPEGFYTQTELQELFDAEFGKNGEQLKRHAVTLAGQHRIDPRPGTDRLLPRLADNERVLMAAYDVVTIAATTGQGEAPSNDLITEIAYPVPMARPGQTLLLRLKEKLPVPPPKPQQP